MSLLVVRLSVVDVGAGLFCTKQNVDALDGSASVDALPAQHEGQLSGRTRRTPKPGIATLQSVPSFVCPLTADPSHSMVWLGSKMSCREHGGSPDAAFGSRMWFWTRREFVILDAGNCYESVQSGEVSSPERG